MNTESRTHNSQPRIVVLTAPSGAGKTTIARRVMEELPALRFSVSATTRPPRAGETDGVHYHFLSDADFNRRLEAGDFVEHEEVYTGDRYGTLRAEVDRATPDAPVLLDIDVKGALNVKKIFGGDVLAIFIRPPAPEAEVLAERLRGRATESEERFRTRLERATMELEMAPRFDAAVVNDDLDTAVEETLQRIRTFVMR